MESGQKHYDEWVHENLCAFMSVEMMFPNESVQALARASGKGKIKEVAELVRRGADVNSMGKGNCTVLYWAMRNKAGFKDLLERGADPNVVFDDGGSVMHWAARSDDLEFLRLALAHGGNPNLVAGQFGVTPLFETISFYGEMGQAPAMSILIENGANLDAVDSNGDTPMIVAAGLGRFDLVYLMLEAGADASIANENGYTLSDAVNQKNGALIPGSESEVWRSKVASRLRDEFGG